MVRVKGHQTTIHGLNSAQSCSVRTSMTPAPKPQKIHSFFHKTYYPSRRILPPKNQILLITATLLGRRLKWSERELTDRKVLGSNPTSASRLPLSRLGQPGSIPALVLPSGGMASRHRKSVTAERFLTNCLLFGDSYALHRFIYNHLSFQATFRLEACGGRYVS
ncbi:hypothetical protein CSKR_100794 [Clonorchis sinensis]|uniref:Uncharacterized protein n=1 Tax=Clonorchis sinensis TaxID=79923 RepID=A0A419QG44_CLOSI|nr:hypothetical protein CSKR_100794 [Clonorchis sinensis]